VAEVINRLPQRVSAEAFVAGDLRHGEICLAQLRPRRVHADEDFRHRLDVQVAIQFNHAHQIAANAPKLFQ